MTGRRSGEPREPIGPPPEPVAELPPVTAALTQESTTGTRDQLRRRIQPTPWMEKVKDYDLNGPGVAGYYLDTVQLMASMCPLFVSVRNAAGEYERSDDPILQVALDSYRGTLMSQPELIGAAVRGRESLGRVWHVRDIETGYNVVPTARSVDNDRLGWTDMYGRPRISPIGDTWRSWNPDPYEPWNPTSPMRRALPDLRRIRSSVRNQTRAADSRMTTNGIISFPHDPSQAGSRPFDGLDPNGHGSGGKQGVPKIIDDFIDLSKLAHSDDESPASMVPFPVPGPAPVWTEIGRPMDPTSLEAERIGIEGFARAVNFPQQLLTQGPGAANHWNEFLTQETAVKVFLAPKLQPVCDDILVFHLQGLIEQFRAGLTEWRRHVDPRHIRVEYDLSFLLRRPSKTNEMIQAWINGIATRQQVADELGIEGEILPLPNGLSEFEMWELATMGKGAPYAEVDRENNLIVPDPMGGMGALPPGEGAVTDLPMPPPVDAGADVASALGGAPAPAALNAGPPSGGTGAVAEPVMPVTAAMSMAVDVAKGMRQRARSQRPAAKRTGSDDGEEPAAVVAALDEQDQATAEVSRQIWADAAAADVKVSSELVGLLNGITVEVQREVARRVIMAHPARSDERVALSKLDVGDVWANAEPEVKKTFPLEETIAEVVERYQPQIQAAYEETAQGFLAKWGGVIAAVVVTGAIVDAADTLTLGFTRWALGRYRPTPSITLLAADAEDRKGLGLTTGKGTPAIPPTMIVRDSMIVAGGAQRDRDGRPLRDRGGNPTPVVNDMGGRWAGGSGWLTGHSVVAASPRRPVRWRWHHAFIRRPKEPYIPHKDLDGKLFDSQADVPGGFFPNDHPHCSCALLPEV